MDIQVKNFADLTDQELADWRSLQQSDHAYISPFFTPSFASAVNGAGKPVLVALVKDKNRTVGIFPFHKGRLGKGIPVGGQISDYQGPIGEIGADVDVGAFLKSCGLRSYDFNHLPSSMRKFADGRFAKSISPYLDLSDGFDAYLAERRSKKNKVLKNAIRNHRILERDTGPVRLELDDQSDEAWQTLVKWKNQSLQAMGVKSILEVNWARQTFESIRKTKTAHFAGLVSSLYVGDRIAAVHFGMRSHATLHWWFPTYDQELRKYSPGIVLLLEVAKQLPDQGITKLDLGRGAQPYKKAFASGVTELCEGSVESVLSVAGSARIARKALDKTMHRIPGLSKPANLQRRALNRLLGSVTLGR